MRIAFFVSFLLVGGFAKAQQQDQVFTKSGFFYFLPYYVSSSDRLTTSSGQLAKFEGDGYGLRLGVSPFPNWLPGLSITADFSVSEGANETDSSEKIKWSQVSYGLAQYMNRFLYLSAKYSEKKITVADSLIETELNPTSVAMGIGIDVIRIGDTFALSLEADYNKGFSERTKNQNAAYNAGSDGIEYRVGIRWSPGISFTAPSSR
ncbi:MAG: hypothetical protein AABZ31_10865 [Bdellovibrionota bacterium]